jgi:hypothetical protein
MQRCERAFANLYAKIASQGPEAVAAATQEALCQKCIAEKWQSFESMNAKKFAKAAKKKSRKVCKKSTRAICERRMSSHECNVLISCLETLLKYT